MITTRVYKFGLLKPSKEDEQQVRNQIRLAHRYRNQLIAIEMHRRNALRDEFMTMGDLAALTKKAEEDQAELDEALKEILKVRAATRSRAETPAMKERIKSAREARKASRAALQECRRKIHASEKSEDHVRINDLAGELKRNARAHRGDLYWGTYLLVEAAHEASCKSTPLFDGPAPNNPRFLAFRGDGSIGVQIQGGIPATDAFEPNTLVRIELIPDRFGRNQDRKFALLHIRIGSNESKKPIWASFPMVMHRPFPPGAVIKGVTVSVRKDGPSWVWTAEFTIEFELIFGSRPQSAVAIDIGWRMIGPYIRVGVTFDGNEHDELRLFPSTLHHFKKASELRGLRDNKLDLIKVELNTWLENNVKIVPPWLLERTATLRAWKSQNRLTYLAGLWADHRFDGDEEGYLILESWRYRDHHLNAWEAGERNRSLNGRKDIYRCWASRLASTYTDLILEKFDLRTIALRNTIVKNNASAEEIKKSANETARSNRHLAALSEMRSLLIMAFYAKGGNVQYVSAVDSTIECHECGVTGPFDKSLNIQHTCASCGATWDQDYNASINLWRRREDGKGKGLEGKKEGRFVRRKKELSDKATTIGGRRAGRPSAEEGGVR